MMSIKTSNNMEVIERMEFHKFNSLMIQLNIYIEAENATNKEGAEGQPSPKDEMASTMASSKKMMQGMKPPSIKK